ncbi:hypothetical protein V501_02377 [Pseudogymnoascus sp. VKM F-4519 (FW-2642)]|nr:hypothetical protein V501_02377 [Pseudogymnoascus sp. VKM F-4519 (FW-2642)]
MSADSSNFTTTTHRAPYAGISPSRPELSQRGKVVLITGSSGGIGFAIARSFAKAGAAKVIMTGRRQGLLDEAVTTLSVQFPKTSFVAHQIDIAKTADVENIWNQFDVEGLVVDVLVLNAARIQHVGSLVDIGYREVWADFTTNVGSHMVFTDLFYHQKKRHSSKRLFLVNVSTCAIHDFEIAAQHPNYSASKSAGTILLQQVAKGVSADDMQVVSFHPGAIFTSAAKDAGYNETTMKWDDEDLPGHYAVWAASDQARFLHGRFTWAAWDVEELSGGEKRARIDRDANFLKVGVVGL